MSMIYKPFQNDTEPYQNDTEPYRNDTGPIPARRRCAVEGKDKDHKNSRRIIALLAFVFLAALVLLSCGRNTKTGPEEKSRKETVAAPESKEETVSAPESKEQTSPAISIPDGISFEVRFLLNPAKVLDEEDHLKEEWEQAFGITEEWRPIEVMYLETPDREFQKEGWINRLRWKSGKKKAERTYKKRYPVAGMDIAAALETAEKDGFTIPEKKPGKEPGKDPGKKQGKESGKKSEKDSKKDAGDVFEVQIDWGYEEMVLNFSMESSAVLEGYEGLTSVGDAEAKEFMKCAMPEKEADWKESRWGIAMLDQSKMAGPVCFLRAKGILGEREITAEIWPVSKEKGGCVVELSLEAENYKEASDAREALTAFLDEKGILLHEDSLKTQEILDGWL